MFLVVLNMFIANSRDLRRGGWERKRRLVSEKDRLECRTETVQLEYVDVRNIEVMCSKLYAAID